MERKTTRTRFLIDQNRMLKYGHKRSPPLQAGRLWRCWFEDPMASSSTGGALSMTWSRSTGLSPFSSSLFVCWWLRPTRGEVSALFVSCATLTTSKGRSRSSLLSVLKLLIAKGTVVIGTGKDDDDVVPGLLEAFPIVTTNCSWFCCWSANLRRNALVSSIDLPVATDQSRSLSSGFTRSAKHACGPDSHLLLSNPPLRPSSST